MAGSRDNHQFLVVAFQLLESIFAEISGVCLFAMNDKHGIFDFIRTAHKREVDKWNGLRCVPSLIRVERTFVITARGLVVGMVVLEELRSIGRQFVGHTATRLREAVAEIFRALRRQCLAERIAGFGIVIGIKIAVGINAAHVVHCRSDSRFDARVGGCGIDSKTTPTANADNTYPLRIDLIVGSKEIDSSRKILCIDVW